MRDGIPNREEHPEPKASRRPFMLIGWIANFGTWITIGIIRFLFPKLCVGQGISSVSIGSIDAVLYASWALMFMVLIRYRRWAYRLAPLLRFQLLVSWPYSSSG